MSLLDAKPIRQEAVPLSLGLRRLADPAAYPLVARRGAAGRRRRDWRNKLTDSERHLLTQIFRFFTQADVEVNNCYMRHYPRASSADRVQMMLAAFSAMETVHVAAYSHLLDTIGMPETGVSAFLHVRR